MGNCQIPLLRKEKPDKSAENEEEGRYFRVYENKEL